MYMCYIIFRSDFAYCIYVCFFFDQCPFIEQEIRDAFQIKDLQASELIILGNTLDKIVPAAAGDSFRADCGILAEFEINIPNKK